MSYKLKTTDFAHIHAIFGNIIVEHKITERVRWFQSEISLFFPSSLFLSWLLAHLVVSCEFLLEMCLFFFAVLLKKYSHVWSIFYRIWCLSCVECVCSYVRICFKWCPLVNTNKLMAKNNSILFSVLPPLRWNIVYQMYIGAIKSNRNHKQLNSEHKKN